MKNVAPEVEPVSDGIQKEVPVERHDEPLTINALMDIVRWLAPKRSPGWESVPFSADPATDDAYMIRLAMLKKRVMGGHMLSAMVTIDLLHATRPGEGIWLHLSIARPDRLPTWTEIAQTRDALGYEKMVFVQLLPPASAWLNVHSHCLHLMSRLDGPTVPMGLWDQIGADGTNYRHAQK